jgi:hypothetical protein
MRGILVQEFLKKAISNQCHKKPLVLRFQILHSQCNLKGTHCFPITLTARLVIGMGSHAIAMNAVAATMS